MRVAGVLTATYGDTLAVVRSPFVSLSLLRRSAHPLHAGAQLIAKSNHGFLATHEGVDVGGERLGKEVQRARPPADSSKRSVLMSVNLCPAGDGVRQKDDGVPQGRRQETAIFDHWCGGPLLLSAGLFGALL